MVVVAAACFLVAVALAVGLVRSTRHIADLDQQLSRASEAGDEARAEAAAAHAEATAAHRARDDALERAQRARRDAADVGARLRDEVTAREAAEAAVREASGRVDVLEAAAKAAARAWDAQAAELEAVRRELAEHGAVVAPVDAAAADILWALALERVERTWRTSISLGIEDASPLVDSDDPLRTAVEIEIEAAHEEAGAAIDLQWTAEGPVAPATALVVLGVIESVIQSLAKTAATTTIDVRAAGDGVEVAFAATDDDGTSIVLDLPEALETAPGRVRVGVPT